MEKKCIRCGEVKPKSEFYAHKKMPDGTLNACKNCVKLGVKIREQTLRQNPDFVESEKDRHRKKYHRLNYREKHKTNPEARRIQTKAYLQKYPEKAKVRNLSQHLKPLTHGNHLHHWSYKLEHAKDVIEISLADHYYLHRHIVYDQERMMYRRADNNILLDSREAHEAFIKEIINP